MAWWQLSLLGCGCTIGTGFFLGFSLAIQKAGPAVIILFLLAALATYFVYEALGKMAAKYPEKGSFRTYAKKAFGKWAGFSNGWMYCTSEILIMGSQLTALSIFSRFWFPNVPLWIFSLFFSIAGLAVLFTGMKGFERMENLFGIIKTAAIVMFIVIAIVMLTMGDKQALTQEAWSQNIDQFFSEGAKGLWLAFLFAFYAYGGIEVMGLLAIDLKHPKQAPLAGSVMIIALTIIYVCSIALALSLLQWDEFNIKQSPFITALSPYDIPFVPHLFTAILIIAGFSTMVAALYAVMTIVITLAEDKDAPPFIAKKGRWNIPIPAFVFTSISLLLSVVVAFLLPKKIFEYITTAAGIMLLYNWIFILVTYFKLMKVSKWSIVKVCVGIGFILIAISGTLGEETSRYGWYVSMAFLLIISIATWIRYFIYERDTG